MEEIWKDIEGFEEKYEVSSFGKVRNKKNNRELVFNESNKYNCLLQSKTATSSVYLKTLVASHFLENPFNYHFVIHKDGDISNNKASNLFFSEKRGDKRTHIKSSQLVSLCQPESPNLPNAKEVLHDLSILIDSVNSSTKKLQDIEAWALRGIEHFKDEPEKRYFFEELLIKIS